LSVHSYSLLYCSYPQPELAGDRRLSPNRSGVNTLFAIKLPLGGGLVWCPSARFGLCGILDFLAPDFFGVSVSVASRGRGDEMAVESVGMETGAVEISMDKWSK